MMLHSLMTLMIVNEMPKLCSSDQLQGAKSARDLASATLKDALAFQSLLVAHGMQESGIFRRVLSSACFCCDSGRHYV